MISILLVLLLSSGFVVSQQEVMPVTEEEIVSYLQNNKLECLSRVGAVNDLAVTLAYLSLVAENELAQKKYGSAIEKLNKIKYYVAEKMKLVQQNCFVLTSLLIQKKKGAVGLKQENIDAMEKSYMRYLDLFYQELEVLVKLLIPLKDCDSMTQEEIDAILTV